jgi:hypothetical protein
MTKPSPGTPASSASHCWKTSTRATSAGWWSARPTAAPPPCCWPASDEEQRSRIGNQTGGRVGFFLNTDDFHRDHAAMLAAGVEFLEAPREGPATVAVFRDLYGNTWDLLEPRQ